MIESLIVGQLYSNEEIFRSLKVSNAGGIRPSLQGKAVLRAAIMTSVQDFHGTGENPYHDRLEGGILIYKGHDCSTSANYPQPKKVDQPEFGPNGYLTQNGLFADSARRQKGQELLQSKSAFTRRFAPEFGFITASLT